MIRTNWAVPAMARISIGTGKCSIRSHTLCPGPRRQRKLRRKQPTDADVEQPQPEIHDDQCQQEVRQRKPDEADKGEYVITDRILPHCRIDADRQSQPPGHDNRAQRQDHRQPQPIADDLGYRTPIFEGLAEIPPNNMAQPFEILHKERLIQTIGMAQRIRLGRRDRRADGRRLSDIGIDEITWRQLKDDEGDDGDRPNW